MRCNYFICLWFLFMLPIPSEAQQTYYFSYQIDSMLAADQTTYKYQTAAWNFSFIGDVQQALVYKDKQFRDAQPGLPSTEQQKEFEKYHTTDAREEILRRAALTNIMIINEAHHISQHRVYLASLLDDLYQLGYRFIGMEALGYTDSLLNKRGYPLLSTGFYTREPQFGNLIRESLQKGFTLFPYEQKYEDKEQLAAGREKVQALNIQRMMAAHPESKFIIYCGYDHVIEDTLRNFMGLPMAGQLKKLTGIDPFTIDQTVLTEYANVGSRYRQIIRNTDDVVFVDNNGMIFNPAGIQKPVDCSVYHPNTIYKSGRAHWLMRKPLTSFNLQTPPGVTFPYLIKVYLEGNDKREAVPVDVVEVKSAAEVKAVMIYKGKKHIAVFEGINGVQQELKIE